MQFLCNQLPDFKKFLKLLNPDTSPNRTVCRYPPHLNCATTLSCETMTMKNHNFHRNACIEIRRKHRLQPVQNSVKTVYLKVLKVSGPSFHTSSKFFDDAQYGLVDRVVWQIVPCGLQDFLQLIDDIWLGLKCHVACEQALHPAGIWNQMAQGTCNLQPVWVTITGFHGKVCHLRLPSLEWNAVFLIRHSTHQQSAWRGWQISPFRLPGDFCGGGYIVHCSIGRNVRIKQLQEFLKSDNWLRRNCILSAGVFYFEPPCRKRH